MIDLDALVRQHVYDEMVRTAEARNLPHTFIDHIKIERIGPAEWTIYNDWHEYRDGKLKPLGAWFEDGTGEAVGESIYVQPRKAKVLMWPADGPEAGHPQSIYSRRADNVKGGTDRQMIKSKAADRRGWRGQGPMLASKGHYVTGLPKSEAMKTGFERGMQALARALEAGG